MDVLIIPIGQRTLRACVRDACDETEKTIYIYIYTYRLFSSSSFREICFHGVEKFEGKGRDGGKKRRDRGKRPFLFFYEPSFVTAFVKSPVHPYVKVSAATMYRRNR